MEIDGKGCSSIKKMTSTGKRHAEHPFAGRNTQLIAPLFILQGFEQCWNDDNYFWNFGSGHFLLSVRTSHGILIPKTIGESQQNHKSLSNYSSSLYSVRFCVAVSNLWNHFFIGPSYTNIRTPPWVSNEGDLPPGIGAQTQPLWTFCARKPWWGLFESSFGF